jgi:two-component system, OmpR family, alkaline phosphatase synthesis response regulator PhoP
MRYNGSHMSQKKILIIEDSADLADSLEDMLTFKGYDAIKATNGKQGFALATLEKPDLILLDLKLPDIEGYDVLRKLRADSWGKTARVLILTASDTSESVPDDIVIDQSDILHKTQWGIENLAIRIESELHHKPS